MSPGIWRASEQNVKRMRRWMTAGQKSHMPRPPILRRQRRWEYPPFPLQCVEEQAHTGGASNGRGNALPIVLKRQKVVLTMMSTETARLLTRSRILFGCFKIRLAALSPLGLTCGLSWQTYDSHVHGDE